MNGNISMPPLLRAVIRSFDDKKLYEAKLLELDLAVSGSSVEEVCKEIENALLVIYQAARKHDLTPFASFVRTENSVSEVDSWWNASSDHGEYSLELPDHVLDALTIALRAPEKRKTVSTTTYAAAA